MGGAAAFPVPEDHMDTRKKFRWLSMAAVAMSLCAQANSALAEGPPSLGGTINGKSGPANARVWVFGVGNNGPGLAVHAEITGVTLVQTSGPACSPIVTTQFPMTVGNIPAQGVAKASVTIDFKGCDRRAMFKVTAAESANRGAATGTIVRLNQFQ